MSSRRWATARHPTRLASLIDHTLLKPDATRENIEQLCREAAQFCFASVCVNPNWVPLCRELLRGSGVKVCTVIGFPFGSHLPDVKAYEARRAVETGAEEVDMVINIGALKSRTTRSSRWTSAASCSRSASTPSSR